ncbi:MAG: tRNA threonylcarbamoyladenosine dehydratase [Lachnospiraceae bacterium]|nr:tRNA threonylcarbamoyladenosine dehydratase [Lachnospiraceae bacterium]
MTNAFSRTALLLGDEAMKKLASSHVAVFGIGGVGGYTVEALVRSGIGALTLVDNDTVSETNLNRQIVATVETIGRDKVEVAKERIRSIAPSCEVTARKTFFLPETAAEFDFTQYDYVVDAIDTVTGKLALIEHAKRAGVPVISSMGAGNKLDPTAFRVADIYETSVCPLAKVMRKECRARGIDHVKVVYSTEEAMKPQGETEEESAKRAIPGSVAFVPSVAGLIIAGEVIKDLIKGEENE